MTSFKWEVQHRPKGSKTGTKTSVHSSPLSDYDESRDHAAHKVRAKYPEHDIISVKEHQQPHWG